MEIKISDQFKEKAIKAIAALVLFVVVYLLLVAAAVGLTVLCVLMAIGLIILKANFLTLAIGIGLVSLGGFILFFLFKFVFKTEKIDRSHLVEITETEEPGLFTLIGEVVQKVGTHFPKKVFLSADVNAAVFYHSSFWSMFFPVRKNLQIGLGLVNTTTEQEFKAVLAHEFGHFSQRSMKVGSYVYNMNQVIFNLLNNDEGFENALQKWSQVSIYFVPFLYIAIYIIRGIQWILRKLYALINIQYMALSREMEFHADAVAAHVTGYKPLKTSLLRMNIADHSWNTVLQFYDQKISDNLISPNLFREQRSVMDFWSKEHGYVLRHQLPDISVEDYKRYDKSKLNITNQWASHPATEDRVRALESLNIEVDNGPDRPAKALFKDFEQREKQFTARIFETVEYTGAVSALPIEQFEQDYVKTVRDGQFDRFYNGYYDDKHPVAFKEHPEPDVDALANVGMLFSREQVDKVYEHIALAQDRYMLQQIAIGTYNIRTFDYDGYKYRTREVHEVANAVEKIWKMQSDNIDKHDQKIFAVFHQLAQNKGKEADFQAYYSDFEALNQHYDRRLQLHGAMAHATHFMHVTTPFNVIENSLMAMTETEGAFEEDIRQMLKEPAYTANMDEAVRQNFEQYCSSQEPYFSMNNYNQKAIDLLFKAMHDYYDLIVTGHYKAKKALLAFQVGLVV
jgi:Zn-dependent protease with chaperone function